MKKNCKKCGLELAFRKLPSGRWCPMNPDGTDHWDLCEKTWLANMPAIERAAYDKRLKKAMEPIRRIGSQYRPVPDDGSDPWW